METVAKKQRFNVWKILGITIVSLFILYIAYGTSDNARHIIRDKMGIHLSDYIDFKEYVTLINVSEKKRAFLITEYHEKKHSANKEELLNILNKIKVFIDTELKTIDIVINTIPNRILSEKNNNNPNETIIENFLNSKKSLLEDKKVIEGYIKDIRSK